MKRIYLILILGMLLVGLVSAGATYRSDGEIVFSTETNLTEVVGALNILGNFNVTGPAHFDHDVTVIGDVFANEFIVTNESSIYFGASIENFTAKMSASLVEAGGSSRNAIFVDSDLGAIRSFNGTVYNAVFNPNSGTAAGATLAALNNLGKGIAIFQPSTTMPELNGESFFFTNSPKLNLLQTNGSMGFQFTTGEIEDALGTVTGFENRFEVMNITNESVVNINGNLNIDGTVTATTFFENRPTKPGLIYSMDFEQLNSTTQYDKGTKGLTTTVYNGGTVSVSNGFMGSGLNCDNGFDQYAATDENLGISGNDPWTIQFRSILTRTAADDTWIQIGIGNGGRFNVGRHYGQEYTAKINNADWRTFVDTDSEWHQQTITYNGTDINWYVDGVLIGTRTQTLTITDAPVNIGKQPGAGASYNLDGNISNIKIWDRVLTKDEWNAADVKDMGDSVVVSDSFKIWNTSDSIVMEVNSTGLILNEGSFVGNGSGLIDVPSFWERAVATLSPTFAGDDIDLIDGDINFKTPNAGGSQSLVFHTDDAQGSLEKFRMKWQDNSQSGSMTMYGDAPLFFVNTNEQGTWFEHNGGDDVSVITLAASGDNGSDASIHAGNRTPNGNIDRGGFSSIYFRGDDAGIDNAVYIHKGDGVSQDWHELFALNTDGTASFTDDVDITGNFIVNGTVNLNDTLYVDGSGNVGIGTSSPTFQLETTSKVNFSNWLFVRPDLFGVGINIDDPSAYFEIGHAVDDGTSAFRISDDESNFMEIDVYDAGTDNISYKFLTTNNGSSGINNPLSLTGEGLVGINQTLPSAQLDVVGDTELNGDLIVTATDSITLDNTNSAGEINMVLGSDTTATSFNVQSDSLTDLFTVNGVGHVGIGGTPETRMDIYQQNNLIGLRLRGTAPETQIGDIYMQNDGRMVLSLDSSGCVSPYFDFQGGQVSIDDDLDVADNANISGNLTVGTNVFSVDSDSNIVNVNGSYLQTTADPVLAGSFNDSVNMESPISVYVSGKYAYVVSFDSDSLTIIDISDTSSPTLVGSLSDSVNMSNARDVYVSGGYTYVLGRSPSRLTIVDTSTPSSPAVVGSVSVLNYPRAVQVIGKYAYVLSDDSDSLTIIDISDASSPIIVGSYDEAAAFADYTSLYVSGKYAYITSWTFDSLTILDISDPTNITFAGEMIDASDMFSPESVYVSGKYAYVVGYDYLNVIDISDPSNLTLTGRLRDAVNLDSAGSVYVSGRYAYVTEMNHDSFTMIDISNPSSPTLAGSLADSVTMEDAYDIYVSGKYAYVIGITSDSLAVIDIGGIDSPAASIGDLAVSTLAVSDKLDVANDLSVGNGLAVGGSIYGAGELSVSNDSYLAGNVGIGTNTPTQKLEVNGSIDVSEDILFKPENNGDTHSLLFYDDPVQGGEEAFRMQWADNSQDGTMNFIGDANVFFANTRGDGYYFEHAGGGGTNADENYIMHFDTTDYIGSKLYGSDADMLVGTRNPHGLMNSGSYGALYMKTGPVGEDNAFYMQKEDTDWAELFQLNLDGSANFTDVWQSGGTNEELYTPESVASFNVGDDPEEIRIIGKYAYIIESGSSLLRVVDINDPSNPILVSTTSTGISTPEFFDVKGNFAYILDSTAGALIIMDIVDPSSPFIASTKGLSKAGATAIDVVGGYAYVIDSPNKKLTVFNVMNPGDIELIDEISLSGNPTSIEVIGSYAYITSFGGSADLEIVDVSDPEALGILSATNFGIDIGSMDVSGNYVYVTENDEVPREFIIIDATDVTAPVIVSNTSIMDNTQAPRDIIVSDGYAYMVTSTDNDLLVWDVSDPTNPQIIGYRALAATPKGIEISGKNVYITEAGTQDDLEIMDISGIEVQSARIHSLEAGTVSIFNDMYADANVNIKGGLDVGIGGIHTDTDIISGKNMIALNRIGIGTETPLGMLDLTGTTSTEPNIYMTDNTFFNEFRLHTGDNAVNFRVDDVNLISDSRFQWFVDGNEVAELNTLGDLQIDRDLNVHGTVIPDNFCGVTSATFTSDSSGALSDATYEWSFGSSLAGENIKSVQACNGTVTSMSWSCATGGTNTRIAIAVNGSAGAGCYCQATDDYCHTICAAGTVDFSIGEGLNGYTVTDGGASDCVATWWVRYD